MASLSHENTEFGSPWRIFKRICAHHWREHIVIELKWASYSREEARERLFVLLISCKADRPLCMEKSNYPLHLEAVSLSRIRLDPLDPHLELY